MGNEFIMYSFGMFMALGVTILGIVFWICVAILLVWGIYTLTIMIINKIKDKKEKLEKAKAEKEDRKEE